MHSIKKDLERIELHQGLLTIKGYLSGGQGPRDSIIFEIYLITARKTLIESCFSRPNSIISSSLFNIR